MKRSSMAILAIAGLSLRASAAGPEKAPPPDEKARMGKGAAPKQGIVPACGSR